jgi:hypothetical protein
MEPERWWEAERLCLAALEREESAAFLKEACPRDEGPATRGRVAASAGATRLQLGTATFASIHFAVGATPDDSSARSRGINTICVRYILLASYMSRFNAAPASAICGSRAVEFRKWLKNA